MTEADLNDRLPLFRRTAAGVYESYGGEDRPGRFRLYRVAGSRRWNVDAADSCMFEPWWPEQPVVGAASKTDAEARLAAWWKPASER
jgi:hypothetical protein